MTAKPSKTICFDLDGTLCSNTFGDYEAAEPFPWAIERVNELARAGHRIVIFTARGTATGMDWESVTRSQLERWGVSYDELRFGKPSADVYVDDRAVHTDSWRISDVSSVPGFSRSGRGSGGEELPAVAPPHLTSVAETGRTFGGETLELDRHVERAGTLAARAGIRSLPSPAELRGAVQAALRAAWSGEELVFTLAVWDAGHVAFADAFEPAPSARAYAGCRRLRDAARGLTRFLVGDGESPSVAAITPGGSGRNGRHGWPLRREHDGVIGDALGGQLGLAAGGAVVLEQSAAPRAVASLRLAELATELGIELSERRISPAELERADEVFIVGFPFCLLPVASVDGRPIGDGGQEELSRALLSAWGRWAGLDLAAQTSSLARAVGPEATRPLPDRG